MEKIVEEADIEQLIKDKDVDGLIEVLRYGGLRSMQMDAALALGLLEDDRAVDALVKTLEDGYLWPDIRVCAARALTMIGGAQAGKALQKATKDDHESVRDITKKMLEMYPSKLSSTPLDDSKRSPVTDARKKLKKWWQFWK